MHAKRSFLLYFFLLLYLIKMSLSTNLSLASLLFDARMDFPAGDIPQSVAVGDLNDDGFPDLVVANGYGDDVSVLLGYRGGFFHIDGNYETGDSPNCVTLGDLDKNGNLDLAVTVAPCEKVLQVLSGMRSLVSLATFTFV